MREEKLMLSDGSIKEIMIYEPTESTRIIGTFQILHGMAEHMKRYQPLAEYFCRQGYRVILHNHQGHGFDISDAERGHYDSIDLLVEHSKEILDTFKVNNLPILLFGHSMGSVIARQYAVQYPMFDALILSGTSYYDLSQAASKNLLKSMMRIKGRDERSELINKIAIKQFNRRIKPNVTPSDWLSVNEANVKDFIADPYTGFNVSLNVLYEIVKTLKITQKKSSLKKMNKAMPILLVSGEDDAFSNYGKGIERLGRLYKDAGFEHVTVQLYEHSRHEVLFEENQNEVIDNINQWLKRVGLG